MNSKENTELPKVGDWVVYMACDDQHIIMDVLPRQNELSRKKPGRSSQKQVIAANIDAVLILLGLDRDFNLQRLQRYLHQVYTCGILPIVILNKQDLVNDPEGFQVSDLGYMIPDIAPVPGQMIKSTGDDIQQQKYDDPQSSLDFCAGTFDLMMRLSSENKLDASFARFAQQLFRKGQEAGYGQQRISALIKTLR